MQLNLFADPLRAEDSLDLNEYELSAAPAPAFRPIDELGEARQRKKYRQAFYTPLALVGDLVELARIWPAARILEPSAGDGRIVHALRQAGALNVDACEIDPLAHQRCATIGARMVGADFLAYRPGQLYDRILMNPPFTAGQAKKHIEHAYRCLAPTGQLISIAPASLAADLAHCQLDLPGCQSATYEKLAPDTFKESGASASVLMVWIDGPAPTGESYGFSTHSTGSAALTIESTFGLYELTRQAFAPGLAEERAIALRRELRRRACEELAQCGASCYGINWPELFAYFTCEALEGNYANHE